MSYSDKVISVENKLSEYCKGYDINDFSVGRLMIFLAEHQYLGIELDEDELSIIGNLIKDKKKGDFESAHKLLENVLYDKYNQKLPKLGSVDFPEINNEFDYLTMLAQTKGILNNKLPKSTKRNILKFRSGDIDDKLKKIMLSNKFKLFFLKPEDLGIEGLKFIMLREKSIQSIIIKGMERLSQVYFGEKGDESHNDRYKIITAHLIYLRHALRSGLDFQQFYERNIKTQLSQFVGEGVSRRFFNDIGGIKFIGGENEINSLKQHFSENPKDYGELNTTARNYLKKGIKDLAIVRSFRGIKEGDYLEARLQLLKGAYLLAEFGADEKDLKIIGHTEYKLETCEKLMKCSLNDESDFGYKTTQMALALGHKLEDILL